MPITIKEIKVNTVIEKKVVQVTDISEDVYLKMKTDIIRELSEKGIVFRQGGANVKKNER